MNNKEYLEHPALSRSALHLIGRSPRHFWWQYLSGKAEPISSSAMDFGSAYHAMLLEPENLSEYIAVTPSDKRRPTKSQINAKKPSDDTRLLIEWWDRFDKENADKIILKDADLDVIQEMADVLHNDEETAEMLSTFRLCEEAFFFEYEGIQFKTKIDSYGNGFAFDLKTTKDASEESFQRSIVNYGYDLQAYMYLEALRQNGKSAETLVIIAQEKTAPYAYGIYPIGETFLFTGEKKFKELVEKYKECKLKNYWPSYTPDKSKHIEAPEWYINKLYDDVEVK